MVAKKYKKRISDELSEVRRDEILHTPLIDEDTSDEYLGETFRMAAWGVHNLAGMEPVKKAFVETELDPQNPYSWADLLWAFASVHYNPGNPGRPALRTREYNEDLARDLKTVSNKNGETRKHQLSGLFLKDPISQRYKTLKTPGGVRSAIVALIKDGFLVLDKS
jgi:hypothetical protein